MGKTCKKIKNWEVAWEMVIVAPLSICLYIRNNIYFHDIINYGLLNLCCCYCSVSSPRYFLFKPAFKIALFELRVFRKQPLYCLHKVGIKFAYTPPSPDPTCGFTLGIVVDLFNLESHMVPHSFTFKTNFFSPKAKWRERPRYINKR